LVLADLATFPEISCAPLQYLRIHSRRGGKRSLISFFFDTRYSIFARRERNRVGTFHPPEPRSKQIAIRDCFFLDSWGHVICTHKQQESSPKSYCASKFNLSLNLGFQSHQVSVITRSYGRKQIPSPIIPGACLWVGWPRSRPRSRFPIPSSRRHGLRSRPEHEHEPIRPASGAGAARILWSSRSRVR